MIKKTYNELLEGVEKFRQAVNHTNPDGTVDSRVIFFRNFIAGGTAGSIAVTTMAPLERAKLLLQIQNFRANDRLLPEKLYAGTMDCLRRIPQEQGYLSFWRGNLASVLRCFPYYALNFAFKDRYREYFVRGIDKKHHMLRRFAGNVLSGGIAGASAVSIIYPLDYARTRLAVDMGKSKESREYRGIWHCLVDTVRKDGLYGLYRGFVFSFIGVFIYRAVYFGLYDTGKDIFVPSDHKHHLLVGFLNAEFASTTSGFLSYPFDTVRRTLMMQSGKPIEKRDYTTSWQCTRCLYKKKGITGFYSGAWTNALRGTGGAMMLVIYDEIHHYLWPKHHESLASLMLPPIVKDDYGDEFFNYNEFPSPYDLQINPNAKYWSSSRALTCIERNHLKRALEYEEKDLQSCPARPVRERIEHICDF